MAEPKLCKKAKIGLPGWAIYRARSGSGQKSPPVNRLGATSQNVDTLGIEPRAFRMRSGCDTTTPCALRMCNVTSTFYTLKNIENIENIENIGPAGGVGCPQSSMSPPPRVRYVAEFAGVKRQPKTGGKLRSNAARNHFCSIRFLRANSYRHLDDHCFVVKVSLRLGRRPLTCCP